MKKKIIYIVLIFQFLVPAYQSLAQLPAAAQALYDSAWAQDSNMVNFALSKGAQVLPTPDGNSFYLQWSPGTGAINTKPLIVTLHGSSGYAFHEFFSWWPQANLHGCGILALQWYRPNRNTPLDYLPDDTIYNYFDSALTAVNYPSGKALLHGFSRGSARSYGVIFNDIQSGNNYFCTAMCNAGAFDTLYPLYNAIYNGSFGPNFYSGKHFNMFCGGHDSDWMKSGCPGMTWTQNWLQGNGAVVDVFIQDTALGHNGFQLQSSSAYKDSILNQYLLCYNAVGITQLPVTDEVNVFPNPVKGVFYVRVRGGGTVYVYNALGALIYKNENWEYDRPIDLTGQEAGIYFCKINTKTLVKAFKLVKE